MSLCLITFRSDIVGQHAKLGNLYKCCKSVDDDHKCEIIGNVYQTIYRTSNFSAGHLKTE